MAGLNKLDEDYPLYTTGQAAQLLEVQESFLRSLDTARIVSPERSAGGHRRYTRRQLALIARVREQLDAGHTLAAASRIIGLQDELADAQDELAGAQDRLADAQDTITDLRQRLGEDDHNPST